jgi:AcrR family transcriptional regulator
MLSTTTFCIFADMAGAARRYHHGDLRRALLERAEAALGDRGASGLSLRELAREVGVSHAAPRRHFAGKQALLDALAEQGFARLERELREAIDGAGGGFDARLAAVARTYVRFATVHTALLELMFAGKYREGADRVRAAGDSAFEAPRAVIAEGQAAGEVIAGDPEEIAIAAWATIQGLATLAIGGMLTGPSLDGAVSAAVERLVLGLRPR